MSSWTSALSQMKKSEFDGDLGVMDDAVSKGFDGELLLSVAMHLASQMHLEQDVEIAVNHRKKYQKGKEPAGEELSPVILDRARVMFMVSTANTFGHAPRLNLGKGRLSSTRVPYEAAEQIFGSPLVLSSRSETGGDAHLVCLCNMLVAVLKIADLCTSGDAIRTLGSTLWARRIKEEFSHMDRLQQELSTTSALAPQAQIVPLTTTVMIGHFLKLNLIFRAFRTMYRAFPDFRTVARKREDIPENAPGDFLDPRPDRATGPYAPEHEAPPNPHLHPPVPPRQWSDMTPKAMEEKAGLWVHEWGLHTDNITSSFMAASLVLHRHRLQPVVPDEQMMATIAYAPDYLSCAVLFGATYTIKMSIMAMFMHRVHPDRAEVRRSIIKRITAMFSEAAGDEETSTSHTSQPASHLTNELPRQCATTLSALLRLYDARLEEYQTRQAQARNSDKEDPDDRSQQSSRPSGSSPSKEGARAASDLDASDSAVESQSASFPVSNTRGTAMEPQIVVSAPQIAGAPGAQFTSSQLFGVPWTFDEAPFYDPMYMNLQFPTNLGFETNGFSWSS
ncbi:hypothetical protein DL93DRAFT_537248 [Clavulina sp. PMI_390]|nr:hypothetical protein DL93DRAFT_537248 [Clavulina sp. PMI_390]